MFNMLYLRHMVSLFALGTVLGFIKDNCLRCSYSKREQKGVVWLSLCARDADQSFSKRLR
jgi:hypothetical protein